MNVLLVEPDSYIKPNKLPTLNDERLLYPPLGLMKLSTYHRDRGDYIRFVRGCDPSVASDLFNDQPIWDRIYITTVFTYNYKRIVETIEFYKEIAGGTVSKIFVGGIAASLLARQLFEDTGITVTSGLLLSSDQIGFSDNCNIDALAPDYSILDPSVYAVNETFYAWTTRGCVNRCPWCAVPKLESEYVPYIDIRTMISDLRAQHGDKSKLKLMDNNVLASESLDRIVRDLLELGYGKDDYTGTNPRRKRVIDFNQGIDASFVTKEKMKLLSMLTIRPMRIAFDRLSERKTYVRALETAYEFGFTDFSNYLLYDFRDGPVDLYERIKINIEMNEKWRANGRGGAKVYSYPMHYAPISGTTYSRSSPFDKLDETTQMAAWLEKPRWTSRFVRNVEIMKGAAHGAISSTPSLAWRTVGRTYQEFLANLYMPEELLRNRDKHERKKYNGNHTEGTGLVEKFRRFMKRLLSGGEQRFRLFHDLVSSNSVSDIRSGITSCGDHEMVFWLRQYIKR